MKKWPSDICRGQRDLFKFFHLSNHLYETQIYLIYYYIWQKQRIPENPQNREAWTSKYLAFLLIKCLISLKNSWQLIFYRLFVLMLSNSYKRQWSEFAERNPAFFVIYWLKIVWLGRLLLLNCFIDHLVSVAQLIPGQSYEFHYQQIIEKGQEWFSCSLPAAVAGEPVSCRKSFLLPNVPVLQTCKMSWWSAHWIKCCPTLFTGAK